MSAVVAGRDTRREMSSKRGKIVAIGEPIALVLAVPSACSHRLALGLRALLFGAGALASSALVNL
jgi:hypothetical protein